MFKKRSIRNLLTYIIVLITAISARAAGHATNDTYVLQNPIVIDSEITNSYRTEGYYSTIYSKNRIHMVTNIGYEIPTDSSGLAVDLRLKLKSHQNFYNYNHWAKLYVGLSKTTDYLLPLKTRVAFARKVTPISLYTINSYLVNTETQYDITNAYFAYKYNPASSELEPKFIDVSLKVITEPMKNMSLMAGTYYEKSIYSGVNYYYYHTEFEVSYRFNNIEFVLGTLESAKPFKITFDGLKDGVYAAMRFTTKV